MTNPQPTVTTAMKRGFMCKCPNCGEGQLFRKFLKVTDACEVCGEDLTHHRADDLPPYVVTTIVGHIVVGGMLWLEVAYSPSFWLHAAIWFPLTLILCFGLIQPVKGAVVGLQWQMGMHGFSTRKSMAKSSPAIALKEV